MVNLLKLILRKVNHVARPRHIQLPGGKEIRLKGFSKEEADKLVDLVTIGEKQEPVPVSKEGNVIPEGAKLVELAKETGPEGFTIHVGIQVELKDTAVSLRKNSSGSYELVTLKFDVESNVAKIENIKDLGRDRRIASDALRVFVANNYL